MHHGPSERTARRSVRPLRPQTSTSAPHTPNPRRPTELIRTYARGFVVLPGAGMGAYASELTN